MGITGAFIFIGVIAAVAIVVFGAFKSRKSITVALVAAIVALLAAGCSWYAFAESQSIPWAAGYGAVALCSLGVGLKHATGSRANPSA